MLKIQNSSTPTELAPVPTPAPVCAPAHDIIITSIDESTANEPTSNISLLINESTLSLSEIVDSSQ